MNVQDISLALTERLIRSHSAADEEASSSLVRKRFEGRPVTITISREAGAQGTTVAADLGKLLNWPVYDQEIIHKISEEMGRPSFHVRSVDEKHFSWLEDVVSNLMNDYHVHPSTYLKYLVGVTRALGMEGKCIIIGRGSNFILPPETTLRVRLVAEREDRIAAIGRLKGISDREAAEWVDRTEKEREQFITRNFHKDVCDPHSYDLVLNMSRHSVQDATRLIVEALHILEEHRHASLAKAEPVAAE
jgi:cytidylate kinase